MFYYIKKQAHFFKSAMTSKQYFVFNYSEILTTFYNTHIYS